MKKFSEFERWQLRIVAEYSDASVCRCQHHTAIARNRATYTANRKRKRTPQFGAELTRRMRK